VLAGVIGGGLCVSLRAEDPKRATSSAHAVRRTPDGQPDLRGTWTRIGGGLNEADPPKALINSECTENFGGKAEPAGFTAVGPGAPPLPKPQHAPATPRPQGIVDPPDRILPYRPEALAARLDWAKKMGPPVESFKYVELSAQCAPPAPWTDPRGPLQILQRPGAVILLYEWDHSSRVFYTDGRPHVSSKMRFFDGDSVARWEGNTLIVDTTNLTGSGYFGVGRTFAPFSDALHLTERFTIVTPDLIDYEMIYDDPKTFTKPVRSVGYLYPADDDVQVMELTCHEGSTTLRNIFGF
jgi:hypothetical protein